MVPASVGFQCPDDARAGARSVRQPRAAYGGRLVERPTATLVLIGINVAVFLATAAGGTSLGFGGGASSLYAHLALQPVAVDYGGSTGVVPGVADGQYWRLLTAMFLHFGFTHILFNMLALFSLGPALEAALGRVRFLALYFLAGLTGSAASYAFGPVAQTSAGASGAIFGLFAAAYVLERRRGLGGQRQYAVLLGINLVLTFTIPFIDWRAHVGGLLGGAVVAAAIVYAPRARRVLVQSLGGAAVLVVIGALVAGRTVALG